MYYFLVLIPRVSGTTVSADAPYNHPIVSTAATFMQHLCRVLTQVATVVGASVLEEPESPSAVSSGIPFANTYNASRSVLIITAHFIYFFPCTGLADVE